MTEIKYPCRCRILDASLMEVPEIIKSVGWQPANPPLAIPHIGKLGVADRDEGGVKINLDDGTVLRGSECWWEPVDAPSG